MIYDYIIVGTGVAGLNAARLIPKDKRVLILCKMSTWNCNTFWAQGGIASAVDESDIPTHIKDTLEAGVNYNDKEAVELLSHKSISTIKNLIHDGMKFDLNNEGKLAYTKEAAHSRNRILHADGDATGRMIHIFLLEHCQHEIVTQAVVCDLLIKDDICYGVQYFVSETEQKVAFAHTTILASGGVGSIYKYHTNSTANAGEVQGIISEKNLPLKDMEMMQFHPTVVKGTSFARKPLLSEALRGEGAHIVDENGYRFLFDYHKDGELAPRDVVSRSIFDYHKKTGLKIFLSFETFEKKAFKQRFPNIYANLKDLGYELPFERVPISPAFHYSMGGVETELNAKIKGMKNLYAIGELACTGVHGANRLASNSLLEGLVFSEIAVETSMKENFKIDPSNYDKPIINFVRNKEIDKDIKDDLRKIMWVNAGIVRIPSELKKSLEKIEEYLKKDVGRLLYLRLLTAKSILKAALNRKKSLGAHFIKED
ncbi:L-aspartate oxidase [Aliarcobacter butzleri]|uniref:L-aspartate oxidase n=2 Tax=Aliarcobacter butzleri TaxID=28197 RepID=A0A837J9C6_9BACT|nr:FAD-binding protein [Aliarcobacter butzleri]AGR77235.1 L-aspartate oxidase [Aliarcobacter butzleri 7h1h]KLE03095.1 aspartate oxidase [Aliarcobacter butzleri L352]MCG3715289.1 FAD-binding protein [Aliarcobacter butzleri]MCT7575629.1 FAD-binding protein [Aliarcobacter butzleri]MCT7586522.1 FAD-binding protein [Aliarcobacter butzleri]